MDKVLFTHGKSFARENKVVPIEPVLAKIKLVQVKHLLQKWRGYNSLLHLLGHVLYT